MCISSRTPPLNPSAVPVPCHITTGDHVTIVKGFKATWAPLRACGVLRCVAWAFTEEQTDSFVHPTDIKRVPALLGACCWALRYHSEQTRPSPCCQGLIPLTCNLSLALRHTQGISRPRLRTKQSCVRCLSPYLLFFPEAEVV